jgi:phosphatidate cytidylyltransferase
VTDEPRNRRDDDEELFEGIRIIGVEPADDDVAPGRSVFADEGVSAYDEPRWLDAEDDEYGDEYDEYDDEPVSLVAADTALDDEDADEDLDDWAALARPEDRWTGEVTAVTVGLDDEDEWDDETTGDDEDHDFFTFDDREQAQEYGRREAPAAAAAPAAAGGRGGDRDMTLAIGTGVGLAVLAIVAFAVGTAATLLLVTALLGVAAAEFFVAVRRAGYQPAALLGIAATVSLSLAAYWRFEAGIPLVLALTVVFSLLWYLAGVDDEAPVLNIGITLLGVLYVGFLGSFAALMLNDDNGVGMLTVAIVLTVAYDVGGLFVGRAMGRQPLSAASPNKTVEGLIGGCVAVLVVAVVMAVVSMPAPFADDPGGFFDMVLLGIVVAAVAPLGDLSESLMKRDLGLKDMGSMLPGHGGLLDRFDGLLFVLPATYYVARLLDLFVGA